MLIIICIFYLNISKISQPPQPPGHVGPSWIADRATGTESFLNPDDLVVTFIQNLDSLRGRTHETLSVMRLQCLERF